MSAGVSRSALRVEAAVSVVKFVLGFVVVVHFRQHGNAAILAAAPVVRDEFRFERAHDAGNNQRMFRRQKAAIAARRIRRRMKNRFEIDFVARAVD